MKKIELTDFYNYKFLSGITFSPDKKKALFIVKNCDKDNNSYKTNLWLLDSETKKTKQLTSAGDVGIFAWLNNEEVIFTAMRDAGLKEKVKAGERRTVVYRLSLDGGEAVEYFRLAKSVSGINYFDA